MRERDLSKDVTRFVQGRNGLVFNVTGSRYQAAGWPDLYIVHVYLPNCSAWLELKVGNNKLSPLQALRIYELRERGMWAGTLRWRAGEYLLEDDEGLLLFDAESLREMWEWLTRQ